MANIANMPGLFICGYFWSQVIYVFFSQFFPHLERFFFFFSNGFAYIIAQMNSEKKVLIRFLLVSFIFTLHNILTGCVHPLYVCLSASV